MLKTDVVIIGGGQSGLVMSRCLSALDIDHIVLERGRVGESWHSERWKSLHLLTNNAMSALPGLPYRGNQPEAFMPAGAFASYLRTYAETTSAPVVEGVAVTAVESAGCEYQIATTAGQWRTRAVVVATGACETPYRPPTAAAFDASLAQMSPSRYREPVQLPEGGVLVVGASSSGAQLAEEIHASGRPVTLAVGAHTRMPRRYRGRDIYAWMEASGILDDPAVETGNLAAARRQPSIQLVGRADDRDLDIGILRGQGIRLLGRLAAASGMKAEFAGDLAQNAAASHARMLRVLDRIDDHIESRALQAPGADPAARIPIVAACEPVTLDLARERIRSIVWATGYARRYPWLKVPVLDGRGELVHHGGVTPAAGLYVLGLTFLRRRRSSFIDGCGFDAEELAPIVKAHLDLHARRVA